MSKPKISGRFAVILISLIVLFCNAQAQLASSKWDDQPEELKKIIETLNTVSQAPKANPDEIMALKSRIEQYSRRHSKADLNWQYWGNSVENIYRLASKQIAKNYEEAEAFVQEGVRLLTSARPDDPNAAMTPMLHLVVFHIHDWVETNPKECAKLWDDTGNWFARQKPSDSKNLWSFHRATIETRILENMNSHFGDSTETSSRRRIVENYIADSKINPSSRSVALRVLVDYLKNKGELKSISYLVDKINFGNVLDPNFFYSQMMIAIHGEKDWSKATKIFESLSKAIETKKGPMGRPLKPSELRTLDSILQIYLSNKPEGELKAKQPVTRQESPLERHLATRNNLGTGTPNKQQITGELLVMSEEFKNNPESREEVAKKLLPYLVKGMTTSELVELLGEPTMKRDSVWRYSVDGPKAIDVYFDNKGIVQRIVTGRYSGH